MKADDIYIVTHGSGVSGAAWKRELIDVVRIDEDESCSQNSRKYPNPMVTQSTILLDKEPHDLRLIIVDVEGRVHDIDYNLVQNELSLFKGSLSAGIYFLTIIVDSTTLSGKYYNFP